MPVTRNATKKRKSEPSSSQNSKKFQKRSKVKPAEDVHDEQVAVLADGAHEISKLADAQTPIPPVPVAATAALPLIPLTSSSPPSMVPKTKPLKGRKRFNADLCELHTTCPSDLDRGMWSAQSFRGGDDEGSVEFDLVDSRDQTRIVVHLLCSDTSEYPNTHSFFCHSPEPGSYGEQVKEICDGVLNHNSSTIHEVAKHFLLNISGDDDGDDIHDDISIDESFSAFVRPEISRSALRRDFEGAHAAGYTPGAIWSGGSEFYLTISVPVVELTDKIPAHVLMSWDSQFLLPRQNLVLGYLWILGDGTLTSAAVHSCTSLKFYVGLSRQYKPSREHVTTSLRQYGLQLDQQDRYVIDVDKEPETGSAQDDGTFDKLSLSSSLESLLDEHFLQVLRELRQAEEEEQRLAGSRYLPHDPLEKQDDHINLLETSFAYLLRRLALCSRYCVVCHKKLDTGFEALKPYVCNSDLCAYQYYSLNFGPSLEYDICKNTEMVDLLVSLAYVAAAEKNLDDPLPRGLALKVPDPVPGKPMRDFDTLNIGEMRKTITQLIDTLPPIPDIKKYLEKKVTVGTKQAEVERHGPLISCLPHGPSCAGTLHACESLIQIIQFIPTRCVASCTAHLQELTEEEDQVQNIGPQWRQFRFMVGAPDKEAKFKHALEQETHGDSNAKKYPTLFAFHGSPLQNWHSIIRHGLWYKTIAHGRAYGDGVYFAKDGSTSMGGYSPGSSQHWNNSAIIPSACVALAEIINLPTKFTSHDPYYVVKQTDWIMCRYLLVNTFETKDHFSNQYGFHTISSPIASTKRKVPNVPFIKHDPSRRPFLSGTQVEIPQPSYKLEKLLVLCQNAYVPPDLDEDDIAVFNAPDELEVAKSQTTAPPANGKKPQQDWVHDAKWVEKNMDLLLPPPSDSTPVATMALQKEFRAVMKEQAGADALATLGWYMPPEFNGENLFQWVVEMYSFDPALPIAKDMKSKGVNSLVFEIRFPPMFPHSPPFFRLVMPRFLPFMQCIASVLLQIRLAISSTDPKPARLAHNWDQYVFSSDRQGHPSSDFLKTVLSRGSVAGIYKSGCYSRLEGHKSGGNGKTCPGLSEVSAHLVVTWGPFQRFWWI
ncbi:uncharacterized protein EDB91DRAFT_1146148 [Suillus paluster]|uniref:uncharacterized protein n=1 Tax=Suillus paluster TaxID=48578 RepID=UPI001B86D44C|nr:uncharacterized protein EDB91DRAFT_1146148 [Suillus paluster]KAG1734953.1 hypothetical protein EDB91DRAFT_1146148 [Suillus paluster]